MHILMLDDEFDSIAPMKAGLERANHTVSHVVDLAQAWICVCTQPLDFVTIDLSLHCGIPEPLQDSYDLVEAGKFNEGRALGLFLWQHRHDRKPNGQRWPGYVYLTNLPSTLGLAGAHNEWGGLSEQACLSKFGQTPADFSATLTRCRLAWSQL